MKVRSQSDGVIPMSTARKKLLFRGAVIAAILLLCAGAVLFAATRQRQISGRVLRAEGDGTFLVQSEDGKPFYLLVSDETFVFSFLDGFDTRSFREGKMTDPVQVSATVAGLKKQITGADGMTAAAWPAVQVEVRGRLQPEPVTLADGTGVQVWQYARDTAYTLADGTELLRVNTPIGPGNVYTGGVGSLDQLPQQAQEKILAFYEAQGLLYDERAELERAYEAYCRWEGPEPFSAHTLGQEIGPTASGDRIIYFMTSVRSSASGNEMTELRRGDAFDKTTGERIEPEALFTCPPEELGSRLLDLAGITDPAQREAMTGAFDAGNILFFPENLELSFSPGSLPGQEHSTLIGLEYEEGLRELLVEGAVPHAPDRAG